MYLPFFNLREAPFNLTPDPRFLFLSSQHEEALTHLLYGIHDRKGFIEITGEVGTGKTLLCRALLEQLDHSVSTALIFNSYLTRSELLEAISREFGLTPEGNAAGLVDLLNTYLLSEFSAGRNAVVVIDEAQNLESTVLEQLRMLSNLETTSGKLLQIVLMGQPELRNNLALPGMRQLHQRIAVRFHINELSGTETTQYIMHRLQVAGATTGAPGITFTRRALALIYQYSGGLPRRINLLCDRVLMNAFVHETRYINATIVRQSVRDLENSRRPVGRRAASSRLLGLALASLTGCALLGVVTSVWMLPGVRAGLTPSGANSVSARQAAPSPRPVSRVIEAAPPAVPPAMREPEPQSQAVSAPEPESPGLREDLALSQALWRLSKDAETMLPTLRDPASADWGSLLKTVAGELDVMPFQPRLAQLSHISRPCFIEVLPHASAPHGVLWIVTRGLPDGVLIYRESGELTLVSLSELRQMWYGALYLTIEANAYEGPALRSGMQGDQVRALQLALKQVGYFPDEPSGLFDTRTQQAVKQFQRDNWLPVDGSAGRQTLIALLHLGGNALERAT